jgi:hypothetical protein
MGDSALKPEPVNVTAEAAEPTTMGVVALVEVMIGATVLGAFTPKAAARLKTLVLLPAPVPLVTVSPHTGVLVRAVTTRVAVPVVGLVIAAPEMACVTVTPLIVSVAMLVMSVKQAAVSPAVSETAAPNSKPEPSKVIGTLAIAVVAEGLTFSIPLPTLNEPAAEAPPSVFATTTANAPGVAGVEFTGLVGVTLKTIEVAVEDVMEDVKDVPFTPEVNDTVGVAPKPVPVMVTVVAAESSHTELGLIDEIVGAASRVIAAAVATAWAPPSSVIDNVQVDAAVPVARKLAVALVVEVSATDEKATVPAPQTAVSETAPPSLMKFVPVMTAVPADPAALTPMALVVAP